MITGGVAVDAGEADAESISPANPSDEERKATCAAFSGEGAARRAAIEDVLWSLLNSAEFVFNH